MFRKPWPLKVAGAIGVGAGLLYMWLALDWAGHMQSLDPYARQDWHSLMEGTALNAGEMIFTQTMIFLAMLALIVFFAALASQAWRHHPSLAAVGGLLMSVAVGMLALRALWVAFVQVPMSIVHHGGTDEAFREILQNQYQAGVFTSVFFGWCYVFFIAPGLILMGVALLPVKRLAHFLPLTFALAGVASVIFIPVLAYIGNQLFMDHFFDRELAGAAFFAMWFLQGLAFLVGGAWLGREGLKGSRALIQDMHLEQAA